MLVVLPTHVGDRSLAAALAAHIRDLGGTRNHDLLIVSPTGTNLAGIEDVLRGCFRQTSVHFYTETMKGWPFGANESAYHIFSHIFANPALAYHFLLMEPDCVPTRSEWMDEIDFEYRRCGKMILGVTLPTVEIDTKKVVGQHVVGVAVYPKAFYSMCPLLKSIVPANHNYQQSGAMAPPWDAHFGPYTARMAAQTTLIQHLPRAPIRDEKGIRWDCPSVDEALRQVSPAAVLVHGCKHPDFLTRLKGGNHATEIRQEKHRIERPRDDERTLVRQSEEASRGSEGQENGHRGSDPREQKEVIFTGTKEEIRLQKQYARADEKKRKFMEQRRKEDNLEFPYPSPELSRAVEIFDREKWGDIKSYGKNLGLRMPPTWNKGRAVCEIVKVEREQRKEEWTEKLPVDAQKVAPIPVELDTAPEPIRSISSGAKTVGNWIVIPDEAPMPGFHTGARVPVEAVSEINPIQRAKMQQLLNDRRMQGAHA